MREVMVIVMRELSVEKPDALEKAGVFNDAVNCVAGTYAEGPPESADVGEVVKFALGTAKRCASTAVEGLKGNVQDILGVIAAFPDTLDALAAVADGIKVSAPFVGRFGGQFDNQPRSSGVPVRIPLVVPEAAERLSVRIWGRFGEPLRLLVDERAPAPGERTIEWDGTDAAGAAVAAGSVIVRVAMDGNVEGQIMHLSR